MKNIIPDSISSPLNTVFVFRSWIIIVIECVTSWSDAFNSNKTKTPSVKPKSIRNRRRNYLSILFSFEPFLILYLEHVHRNYESNTPSYWYRHEYNGLTFAYSLTVSDGPSTHRRSSVIWHVDDLNSTKRGMFWCLFVNKLKREIRKQKTIFSGEPLAGRALNTILKKILETALDGHSNNWNVNAHAYA